MTWIKRNLLLVLIGVAALALLGGSGFLLFSQYQADSEVTANLGAQIEEFKRLNETKPSILDENITAAKAEQRRLQALLEEQRKSFVPVSTLTNIDSATFKSLLETTTDGLEKLAQRQGVRTPTKFAYTFKTQKESLVFDAPDLLPWTYQLLEIRSLCEILYTARIHSLQSIRRAPASKKDGGADFLGGRSMTTNTAVNAVITPYEICFLGFTAELGQVLEGLTKSPACFLVRNINVEPAPADLVATLAPGASGAGYAAAPAYGEAPSAGTGDALRQRYVLGPGGAGELQMRDRYGLGGRYGIGGPGPAPPPPAPTMAPAGAPTRRGPEVLLDEKILRITMLIDSVRLMPGRSPAPAPAPAPAEALAPSPN